MPGRAASPRAAALMPEHRALPLVRWGEELRRRQAARRASRGRALGLGGAAIVSIATTCTLIWPSPPILVWNGSASSPIGLYHVTPAEDVKAGQMVVAWAPRPARRLAAERGYLPPDIPLVKRVVATSGDRVCAISEAVFVNGHVAVLRRSADRSGRPLPWWTGCVRLGSHELFLLMQGEASFDGRYFGVTAADHVIGRASLLWAA
jgi:conjugative transfer signal peptidase TraF